MRRDALLDVGATLLGRLAGARVLPLSARVLGLRALLPKLHNWLSLPELLALISGPAPIRGSNGTTAATTAAVFDRTEHWLRGRRLTGTTCMYRALVRYTLLRGAGVPGLAFLLGVRPDGDELIGHAWITQDGRPLLEELAHSYSVTFQYPPVEES